MVRVDRAHLVQRAEPLTSCFVRNIEVEVGKVAVVDGSQIADAAEAIILRYANNAILKGIFSRQSQNIRQEL